MRGNKNMLWKRSKKNMVDERQRDANGRRIAENKI
jgi:hypothetical protein